MSTPAPRKTDAQHTTVLGDLERVQLQVHKILADRASLLAALRELVTQFEASTDDLSDTHPHVLAIEQARAAIAKAGAL